ncbi:MULTISPECIES: P-type conjugative transfer protein TrbL [Thiomonas]|uniref:P-type conjugative transfer protein TrbL n=1 Tax=Thiomonas arsenitoxydans (strain DSM 22701 / CIP 110005 / 3As) TaxID=426114 RepID=A0A8I1MVP8_THIA3|nr:MULTISPECIES: P-type conjugative transfer protein TrbL [Thiomonas]MBN8744611.1 P-type conjugative transfer protein TrbL [Thiomonas arsenitoxydans]VDY05768.1 P-type conjugative transfer protein TrbL [Thiomonas sp. Bio17B3]VDY10933.1 P-type conjugative transfer protein TrbL [Thiomonas sp. Sup16B3]VDY14027.1 p-type conjugative transfer protein TrbL [Thiomonas sp. OC7]
MRTVTAATSRHALMRKRRAAPSFLIPLGGPDANAAGLGGLSIRVQWAATGLILLLVVAATAHAAPAPTPTGGPGGQGYLDTISSQFQAATTGWMTTAQGYAFKIFTALAAMDLSWWGIKQVLKKNDLADFIAGATLKIASIAFFYTIVKYAPTWMPLITSSFMDMGQAIGGSSAATASPSGVMSMAFSVVHQLYEVYDKAPGGLLNIGTNLFLAIIIAITSLLALIGFGLVALQLLMTLIETYLVGGAGLVMLGFTGSSLTSSFGEKYIGYLVSVGIKLLMIYAIIGLGQNLINSELAYIAQYTGGKSLPPTDLLTVGVSMLIYGVIGMQAPGLAGSLMNGSPNMSLGNVAGGAAAIAGGIAAAGVAGAAGYASAAKGLDRMAGLVGAGAGGGSGAGGAIAGAEKLAALGQATGAAGKPAGDMMGSIGGGGKGGGASAPAPSSGTPAGSLGGAGSTGANTARMGQAAQAMMEGKGISGPSSTPLRPAAPSAPPQPSPAPSAPPKGPVDALGAPSGESGSADLSKAASSSDREPFDVLKDNLGKLAGTKDDIARHEGGGGSGIQIRLGHVEH